MTLKSTLLQNKQINRGVYGLLAIVITIFVSILMLLQFQHNEEIKRKTLDNDYHLAISKYGLELLQTINKAKLLFRDQELKRLKGYIPNVSGKKSSYIQIELRERDQTNELKIEMEKPIEAILKLQAKYADPKFRTVTLLLEQAHVKVHADLDKLLSTGTYSSQMIDTIVAPLVSSAVQLQRLHQHTYQKMYLSYEKFKNEDRVQIIILILALAIFGVVGVNIMLRHVRNTLTKLTNTQNDLQSERDFSNNLITTAPVIILLLDSQRRIQHVNPFFEQLSGYSLDEIKGMEWISTFLPARDHDRIRKLLQGSLQDISIQGNINPIITRSGEERDIEWHTEIMRGPSGTTTGLLSVGMDITGRLQVEEEVNKYRNHLEELVDERTTEMKAARDEAERANLAKSDFLSHMSHELRTPLNAILGFAQMLELDAKGFNKTQRGNVVEILDAGRHLLSLINEVLDLARIESGKLEISMENVHIDDVLQQSIALIDPQTKMRRLNITDNISNKGYTVQADFTRLKQVMVNLLSNAVKYNQDHGQITLDAKIIQKQRLRIFVMDNGQGLTEEEITRLFTSFERLDTTNNVEGTGIGLVITKHLVELMGGTVGVESTPGKGSIFWVELTLPEKAPIS